MVRFRDLPLAVKLLLSFLVMTVLTGVVGAAGYIGVATGQSKVAAITERSAPALLALVRTDAAVNAALAATRGMLVATDVDQNSRLLARATAQRAEAARQFSLYLAGSGSDRQATAARALLNTWSSMDGRAASLYQ